ncbi:glycosyltransferase family 2 protein [Nakamurella antarctica]|uniref:Glycosyltransferase family 2 protein n=1 Tax=Nakamurella antarctica TaxID=1902245 RepID=A0A3G8ZWV6_9ACTN|nr:glycosyltransferase family 2 protein [Nakamurella antarctica]AZI58516.1 glycosyltransferase family 2 protein [Nakamurella antarctica]
MAAEPLPRVIIIVPAWNEQDSLPSTLAEVARAVPAASVLVVSDGSTDNTARIAHELGATVLDLPINLGVGGAMRAGYKYALRHGFDYAVQLDADGQHSAFDVSRLIVQLQVDSADVMIGARFAGTGHYDARGPRRWAMKLLSRVLSHVAGTRLTDTTSGFKASNAHAIRLFASNYPAEYLGDTIESLVIASRSGLVVRQLGVEMRTRTAGQPSHSPVKAALFLLRAALALAVALTRPKVELTKVPSE